MTRPLGFRPWLAALAAGVAAAALAAQQPTTSNGWLDLAPLRAGLGAGWLAFVVLLGAQGAGQLWRAAPWPPRSQGRRVPAPSDGTHCAPATAQGLTWPETLRRAALVSAVTLPRFAGDPAGYAVASLWLVLALACGYAYVAPVLGPRYRNAYWLVAVLFLLPWGLRLTTVHWPAFE
jgi:hypothetical protein